MNGFFFLKRCNNKGMSSFKQSVRTLFFRLAKTNAGGALLRWSFAHMSQFIPLEKVYQSEQVVAFVHPHPAYAVHYLIVPKREIRSLLDLASQDADLLMEVTRAAQYIIRQNSLEQQGYRLITNGGEYQQVKFLHFHLVSGELPGLK
jgi:histidine triad (HIT) family protein